MKKNTFLIKSLFLGAALFFASNTQAQVELKILTEMGTRFNDVNDSGTGITQDQYYDFGTDALTDIEPEATGLNAINNNGEVSGSMYYDEPNFILQPAVKKDNVWVPIGWFPDSNPSESSFSTYGISPNGKYVTGQMSKGCCDFGTFLYDTETQELFEIFDPNGEALAGYTVNNDGIVGGWLDQPNSGGTLRVPAYFNKDGEINLIPDGQSPTIQVNAINDINSSNIMVGDFDGKPFIFDLATETFTTFAAPSGNSATFTSISDNGIAVGYDDVDFQVREAIIYHPNLGSQPVYLKDVLSDLGVTIDTPDGKMGTAIAISPNGNYVVGWVNGPPMYAEGWIVNLDDLILGTTTLETTTVAYYPNPVKDVLNLNTKEAINSVAVYSVTGQIVDNVSISENNTQVDFSNLASGVYFVEVKSNGSVENLKVVKK